MTETREWRTAKIPQWVKDAAQAEMDQWRLTAALSWPTEAKPQPLPFQWGDYDRLIGTPEPGYRYWTARQHGVESFMLAETRNLSAEDRAYIGGATRRKWAFQTYTDGRWHTTAQRGPLFRTEREAKLYRRWMLCEDFACQLLAAMR